MSMMVKTAIAQVGARYCPATGRNIIAVPNPANPRTMPAISAAANKNVKPSVINTCSKNDATFSTLSPTKTLMMPSGSCNDRQHRIHILYHAIYNSHNYIRIFVIELNSLNFLRWSCAVFSVQPTLTHIQGTYHENHYDLYYAYDCIHWRFCVFHTARSS